MCVVQELTYQLQAEAATLDVPVLVKTLQRSLEFEKTLSNQWQTQSVPASPVDGGSSEDEGNDPMLPEQERIRQKYLRHSRQRQRAERREQRQQALADGKAQDSTTQYKFHGFITSCFDASMHLYVAYEDQQMQETVERLVAEETWGAAEVHLHLPPQLSRTSVSCRLPYPQFFGPVYQLCHIWA